MAESILEYSTAEARPVNEFRSYPGSLQSNWVTVCTAPDVVESDTGVVVGGKVVKPEAIERAAQTRFRPEAGATHLLIALKYNVDATSSADPVVRVFGKDGNGIWHNLALSDGSVEITLATAETTDARSGSYAITVPKQVDMQGSEQVIVAIQTAYAVSVGTANDSEILVKVINSR